MMKYYSKYTADSTFHVFSRAVGDEKLFKEEEDYHIFFDRVIKYLYPIADLYAYVLIPNHFHLLLKFRTPGELEKYKRTLIRKPRKFDSSEFISKEISNMLNSFTKTINKKYSRKGGLFIDYARRLEATTSGHLAHLVFYIHKNPVHHGLAENIKAWPYSSFHLFSGSYLEKRRVKEVLTWFGDITQFHEYHKRPLLV